jgi:hypothetical protein
MHENEEAPEGYMEKEKEERKLGCRKGRNVLGFKESGSRQRERERVVLGRMQLPQRTFNC